MSTNPAYVYQRRVKHTVARLAEFVDLFRPLSGGAVQQVSTYPLIVSASTTIIKGVEGAGTGGGGTSSADPGGSGSSATPALLDDADIYAGYLADLLSGKSNLVQPDGITPNATTAVIPALLLVQDVFQNSPMVGDTFTRDGTNWTINVFGNQLVAGLNIAVLSIALVTP